MLLGFHRIWRKGIVCINDSALRLIIPPQLRKIKHRHKIIYGWKICIQSGTYQEYFNNWCKRRLKFIKNRKTIFISGSVEQLNAENIVPIYSDVVLPDW